MEGAEFLKNLKQYVGFDDRASAALIEAHAVVAPHFGAIIDDFYDTIEAHPGARAAITGGTAQIQRLKTAAPTHTWRRTAACGSVTLAASS